tara:strand:- start:803 stop:1300 length:498 start_codon:yes stop_codon:yes gene_type:complete
MASAFSFDVVSDFDRQELVNVVDQIKRELNQRYDLKDSNSEIALEEEEILVVTSSDMTLQAIGDILRQKATKRNLSLKIFDFQNPEVSGGNKVKQRILLKKGLNQDVAKKLSKSIRDSIKKINVSIQGESLRVTSKSKDDLQLVISLLKEEEDKLNIPLQYENYR